MEIERLEFLADERKIEQLAHTDSTFLHFLDQVLFVLAVERSDSVHQLKQNAAECPGIHTLVVA